MLVRLKDRLIGVGNYSVDQVEYGVSRKVDVENRGVDCVMVQWVKSSGEYILETLRLLSKEVINSYIFIPEYTGHCQHLEMG